MLKRQEEQEEGKASESERLNMAVLKMSSNLKYACHPQTILLAKAKDSTKIDAAAN